MKYFIDGRPVSDDEFFKELKDKVYESSKMEFDEYVDESTGEIDILGNKFTPSKVLKTDEVAYKEALNKYADRIFTELQQQFRDSDGFEVIKGVEFEAEYEHYDDDFDSYYDSYYDEEADEDEDYDEDEDE